MKIIDISHRIDSQTPVYPGDSPTILFQSSFLESDHFNGFTLRTNLHAGTHLDAPMHLTSDQRMIDTFKIECFQGKGVILDVRGEKVIKMKPDYKRICEGDIVLLFTNHDDHFGDEEKYFKHHPIVDDDFAHFLVTRKIKILGMDMPSPDYPPFRVHKILLENDIFILENLTNLQEILSLKSFEVFAVPLKLSAEASLVRAFIRED